MCCLCVLIVFWLTPRFLAMLKGEKPSSRRSKTSCSAGVNLSNSRRGLQISVLPNAGRVEGSGASSFSSFITCCHLRFLSDAFMDALQIQGLLVQSWTCGLLFSGA